MILFAVMYSGSPVRMCRLFMKLSGSLMGILRHGISSLNSPMLDLTRENLQLVVPSLHGFPRERQPREFFAKCFYPAA